MTEFAAVKANRYSYLTDDNDENKKAKGTKKCVVRQKLKFKGCKNCLEANLLDGDSSRENHKEFMKNNKSIN